MPQLTIIADDLTGAADAGVSFAVAGFSTVIPLSDGPYPDADVLVLSTESRDLDADAAARVVAEAVAASSGHSGLRWVYKKIDSALRGHPREELLAAMAAAGEQQALVAPALPSQGRTTIGGRQFVDGVLLEASGLSGHGAESDLGRLFANDLGVPVRHLDLAAVRGRPEAVRAVLGDRSTGIVVADAETDADLRVLAQAASAGGVRVLSGSAGFARQLAQVLPLARSNPPARAARHGSGAVLVVAGSRHEATVRQVAALERGRVPVVRLSQQAIDDPAASVAATVSAVAGHLGEERPVVLTTAGLAASPIGQRHVVTRLAEVVAAPEVRSRVGGMVLTGGDVAAGVCRALGATALWLGGEVRPAVPWGVLDGGALAELPVITKAGSFGDEGALCACVDFLAEG